MGVTWKSLEDMMKREHRAYMNIRADGEDHDHAWKQSSSLNMAEVQRLLYCTHKYKEMMREYHRLFRTHKIKDFAELAEKFTQING